MLPTENSNGSQRRHRAGRAIEGQFHVRDKMPFWQSKEITLSYGEVSFPAVMYSHPDARIDPRTGLPIWHLIVVSTEVRVYCRGLVLRTQEEVHGFLHALARAADRAAELEAQSAIRPNTLPIDTAIYTGWIDSQHDGVHFVRGRMTLRPPSEAYVLVEIVRRGWRASGAYRGESR